MLKRWIMCVLMSFAIFAFGACESEGPAEKAGEKIDEAAEEAAEKVEEAADAVEEKTDEAAK